LIEIRKSESNDAEKIKYSNVDKLNPFDSSELCFTLLEDKVLLAIFGSILINNGTHRLFIILGNEGKQKPILYTKTVKAMLGNIRLFAPAIRRVEITVRNDFKSGKDWASMLGFVEEGILHDYDPEDSGDHVIYYLPKENWDG
tara:strand:- start:1947 stop:2375 length:429 start_codon:yes stop_codon:yes gene_type:complete